MKKVNFVIYESSSFGGCYDYSVQLFLNYQKCVDISKICYILPQNSDLNYPDANKILLNDRLIFQNKYCSKINFLFRNFVNPFRLLFFLGNQPSSFVLLNDFEQLTAPFWILFYKLFAAKHHFGIVLHDPDRDKYPPSYWYSVFCLKLLMNWVDLAFYHDILPAKPYYKKTKARYICIPHGIYSSKPPNIDFLEFLKQKKANFTLISIIGNIRKEKNYEFAIRSLVNFPDLALLITGIPASSDISILKYKKLIEDLGVEDRVFWVEKYLTDSELSAAIELSDVIWLYYAKTFVSQSAIFNLIAPFRKKILVSDNQGSMTQVVKKFSLATLIEPDNQIALNDSMERILKEKTSDNWDIYLSFASWENNVQISMKEIHTCFEK